MATASSTGPVGATPLTGPTPMTAPVTSGSAVRPPVWTTSTVLVAWCSTCGTDVEFATPYGLAPEDLAADERACVWCGEALLVTVGVQTVGIQTVGAQTGARGGRAAAAA